MTDTPEHRTERILREYEDDLAYIPYIVYDRVRRGILWGVDKVEMQTILTHLPEFDCLDNSSFYDPQGNIVRRTVEPVLVQQCLRQFAKNRRKDTLAGAAQNLREKTKAFLFPFLYGK